MADYPHYPPDRTRRLGLAALGILLVALAAGLLRRGAGEAGWQPPLPPAAEGVTTRQSRLLGWRMTDYTTPLAPAGVGEFYDEALPAAGWQPRPASPSADSLVRQYARGRATLEVRASPAEGGSTVSILLTGRVDGD